MGYKEDHINEGCRGRVVRFWFLVTGFSLNTNDKKGDQAPATNSRQQFKKSHRLSVAQSDNQNRGKTQ
jgi:CRISPR/Cas system endoribonuclease Cas6 (RAMP superfamily)